MASERKMTFGVIVGNRGFFPDHLAKTGREEIISVLEAAGARAIVLGPDWFLYGNRTNRYALRSRTCRLLHPDCSVYV